MVFTLKTKFNNNNNNNLVLKMEATGKISIHILTSSCVQSNQKSFRHYIIYLFIYFLLVGAGHL